MVMAQGFTRDQVKDVIENVDDSTIIDDKTRQLLRFSEKITRHAYKVSESDIRNLLEAGCSEEEIFEAVAVTALFNYMDRMADALNAPVENFQEMIASMMQS